VGMGLLSSVGATTGRCTTACDHEPGAISGPGDEERPGAERTGRGTRACASIEPSTCAGRPEIRDLRSHADVRRPTVLGGTAARVRDAGARDQTMDPPEQGSARGPRSARRCGALVRRAAPVPAKASRRARPPPARRRRVDMAYSGRRSPQDRWSSHVRVRSKVPEFRATRAGGRFDRRAPVVLHRRAVPRPVRPAPGRSSSPGPRSPEVVHRPAVARQTRGGPCPRRRRPR